MKYTLADLSEPEVNTILAGLSKLPFENVSDLIPKIQLQAVRQLEVAKKEAAAKVAKKK